MSTRSISLHLSTVAVIHGPRPCVECGGPTNYWHAATRRHFCPPCAFDLDDDGEADVEGAVAPPGDDAG